MMFRGYVCNYPPSAWSKLIIELCMTVCTAIHAGVSFGPENGTHCKVQVWQFSGPVCRLQGVVTQHLPVNVSGAQQLSRVSAVLG